MKPIAPTSRAACCALAIALCAGTAAVLPAAAQEGQPKLPTVPLTAGVHLVAAEVAQTPDQRSAGLMFRRAMGPNEGMIFVFEQPATQCFWMQNTLLPLSVAFVADDGAIVNVDDMKPLTTASHCSKKPVRYVLEMNAGWFDKRGIKAGFKLQGEPFRH